MYTYLHMYLNVCVYTYLHMYLNVCVCVCFFADTHVHVAICNNMHKYKLHTSRRKKEKGGKHKSYHLNIPFSLLPLHIYCPGGNRFSVRGSVPIMAVDHKSIKYDELYTTLVLHAREHILETKGGKGEYSRSECPLCSPPLPLFSVPGGNTVSDRGVVCATRVDDKSICCTATTVDDEGMRAAVDSLKL